jgi:hypothetical protein
MVADESCRCLVRLHCAAIQRYSCIKSNKNANIFITDIQSKSEPTLTSGRARTAPVRSGGGW